MKVCLGKFSLYKGDKEYHENVLPMTIDIGYLLHKERVTYVYIAENEMTNTLNATYTNTYMGVLNLKSQIEKHTRDFQIICFHYKKIFADCLRVKNYTFTTLEELQRLISTVLSA